jgi:hypothetical protein
MKDGRPFGTSDFNFPPLINVRTFPNNKKKKSYKYILLGLFFFSLRRELRQNQSTREYTQTSIKS